MTATRTTVPPRSVILHADMDAFYAAVEQRDRPELRGLPVVVGGRPPRGVVSAASYEARRYGIYSAMPSVEAERRCPNAVFLPGDMAKYARESRRIMAIFESFSPDVEPLSLDEAFIDISRSLRALGGTPLEIGRRLKQKVFDETGLTVSVGIGPGKMVAKILSDLSKPDGLLEVRAEDVPGFLAPLPISRLPGVGPVGETALTRLGFRRLADLARLDAPSDWDRIARRIARGESLTTVNSSASNDGGGLLLASLKRWAALARGEDDRDVEPDREARSYGEENTFASDVDDLDVLHDAILQHADRVARRLRRDSVRGRVVRLKLKSTERLERPGKYRLYSRQTTLAAPTDDGALIARAAWSLLRRGDLPLPVRLLGVCVAGIHETRTNSGEQLLIFDRPRRGELNRALDEIAERFGAGAIRRGKGAVAKAAPSLGIKRGE